MEHTIFQQMADSWTAAVVARTEIRAFTGGAINEKYLANLDSDGLGPKSRLKLGRKVIYAKAELIEWLKSRSEVVNGRDK